MSGAKSIYEHLLNDAGTARSLSRMDADDAQIERVSVMNEAVEYDEMGFGVIDDQLIFTGANIMNKLGVKRD